MPGPMLQKRLSNASGTLQKRYCYRDGEGVKKDEAEAVKWWWKAAEQGESDAMKELAACYRGAIGVERD